MSYTNGLDKPSDYFETKLYTGNAGTLNVTGLDFQPDWVWIKNRTSDYTHGLYDSVRGAGSSKGIYSNTSEAEGTNSAFQNLTSFNSDGFSLGSTSNTNVINTNSQNHVSWNWKAGTSFTNDASSTGIGSIDSAGSVNTDAGFSIVSYTGTGSAGTVAHGLGAIPKFIIIKGLTNTSAENWRVFHNSTSNGRLVLNETKAAANSTDFGANGSGGTITQNLNYFNIGTDARVNGSGQDYIAYLFSEKKGYSKFSSYIGNGNADGTFVYTGFKPAFVMVKVTNTTNNWMVFDNKRSDVSGANVNGNMLRPNLSDAELTDDDLDFLSNGFKWRRNSAGFNGSGNTFIFMCFAENPFTTSTGIPTTAR